MLTGAGWLQEPVIQQITSVTVIPGNGTTPSGPTTYLLYFNNSSMNPNTMYTIALVARDLYGNVQPLIRLVTLSTNDNAPPVWRAIALEPGAINSSLRVQLDEPCTVFWFCFSANVSCPSAALVSECWRYQQSNMEREDAVIMSIMFDLHYLIHDQVL